MMILMWPCKVVPAVVVVAALVYAQGPASSPTSPTAATRQLLLGDHLLSLQWVGWDRFGKASVTEQAGKLLLQGEQRKDGDFVTVEGTITEVLPKGFRFHGKVTTRVSYINKGRPCVRDGNLTFLSSGTRKFWRMQEINNPCDEAADYVDIYFKRP